MLFIVVVQKACKNESWRVVLSRRLFFYSLNEEKTENSFVGSNLDIKFLSIVWLNAGIPGFSMSPGRRQHNAVVGRRADFVSLLLLKTGISLQPDS